VRRASGGSRLRALERQTSASPSGLARGQIRPRSRETQDRAEIRPS
jgi:hypothetical protein